MRFFCSLCNLEITKFSKKEKETHWLSTHFSSELSRFTTGLVCSFCLHKADTRADLLIHVGVKHDKVYNFLPVLPFQTKQSLQGHFNNNPTPIKSNIRLESQSISAGNILLGPSLLVKCKFNSSQPPDLPQHNLTTASIEEKAGLSKLATPTFPIVTQDWYCTYFNNSPIRTSLVTHFCSFLGQEGNCPYCPHRLDQHASYSLHKSEQELQV